MRKKIEWQWEILDNHDDGVGNSSTTSRCKVIGGWLTHHAFMKKNAMSESMTFVPDRDHEWEIAKPFNPSDPGKLHPKVNASDFEAPK